VINAIAEDKDAQKRGLVCIIYYIGTGSKFEEGVRKLLLQWGAFIRFGAPIRIAALHFAYDISIAKEAARLLASASSRDVRLRFVTHHGGKYYCGLIPVEAVDLSSCGAGCNRRSVISSRNTVPHNLLQPTFLLHQCLMKSVRSS
jgi:hypothetical protein